MLAKDESFFSSLASGPNDEDPAPAEPVLRHLSAADRRALKAASNPRALKRRRS